MEHFDRVSLGTNGSNDGSLIIMVANENECARVMSAHHHPKRVNTFQRYSTDLAQKLFIGVHGVKSGLEAGEPFELGRDLLGNNHVGKKCVCVCVKDCSSVRETGDVCSWYQNHSFARVTNSKD